MAFAGGVLGLSNRLFPGKECHKCAGGHFEGRSRKLASYSLVELNAHASGTVPLSFSVLKRKEAPGTESSLSFPIVKFGHSDYFSAR